MAILAFQQPDKVIMIQADEFKGVFEFRPLEPGFGMTIGNALRRILLSSLEGFAITSVRIGGVEHEFSSIKGVMQDVTEIILNLKEVRFKRLVESEESEKVHVVIGSSDVFKAGDMNKFLSNFQVLNPDLEICRMEHNVKLHLDIAIHKGRGYVLAEDNKDANAPLGTIAMDSIHSPIKNVKYSIENYRVEQKTDYERLVFEIITDGSILPKDALKAAARVLIQHFMLFSDEKISIDLDKKALSAQEESDEASNLIRQLLMTRLPDMDLSVRALNCLKAAELQTLGQLVSFNKNDLLKFRNFGKKSLTELDSMLKSKGLSFGMKVEKYKLDKVEKEEKGKGDKKDKEDKEDKVEKEKVEKGKVEKEKVEKEKVEKEKVVKEKAEKEKVEKEKVVKEKVEKEKVAKEKVVKEKVEKGKVEKEKAAKEKVEKGKVEKEKVEKTKNKNKE